MTTASATTPRIHTPAPERREGERGTEEDHPAHLQRRLTPLLLLLTLALIIATLFRSPGTFDYSLLNRVQGLSLPYLDTVLEATLSATRASVSVGVAVALLLAVVLVRRWLPALGFAAVLGGTGLAWLLHLLLPDAGTIDATRLERVVEQGSGQFPSVAVASAVLLYGLLFHLAAAIPFRTARYAARGIVVLAILAAGLSRLWLGTNWPADVAGGYALGGLLLVVLLWSYDRIAATSGHLPFIHAASVPHDESRPHAHALTSTIIFNGPTVSKIYAPGFVPRAIYWLAFQAEFPYIRNQAALRAAILRRNLAGLLTEFWYGDNRVARVTGIDLVDGRYAITSEFIDGTVPTDRHAAREFLFDLADRFDEAGLPTWQIDPRQPRAMDNILQTADGAYRIIDLESGLVSPMASPRAWKRAFQRGLVPLYDDIFFDLTRAYVREHEAEMRQRMGDDWFTSLVAMLDATERATQEWHDSEPRIWGRMFGLRRQQASESPSTVQRAQRWLHGAIDAWHDEGRLTTAEADDLRAEITKPRFMGVLPHFGVHLTIGVVLRFPLGSITRVSYVLLNLLVSMAQRLTRRIDRETWRRRRETHSPLVLLISGMPGIGTFAYLASRPMRANQLMLRVSLDAVLMRLPFRVYERFGLRWLVARPRYLASAPDDEARAARTPLTVFGGPQSIVQFLAFVTVTLLVADAAVTVVDYFLAPQTPGWADAHRLLNTAGDDSFASWYVEFLLLLVAGLLGFIALAKVRASDRFARHWVVLALLALSVSIDKHVVIRQSPGNPVNDSGRLDIMRYITEEWVALAALSVFILALLYLRFLLALPRLTRLLFVAGSTLFVTGEIGFQMIAVYLDDAAGTRSLVYRVATSAQEALIMTGVLIVIAGLLLYLQERAGEVRVVLSERYIATHAAATRSTPDTGVSADRLPSDAAPTAPPQPLTEWVTT